MSVTAATQNGDCLLWDCGAITCPLLTEARPLRAPRVPTMTDLSGFNVLIVDAAYSEACDLRTTLLLAGANVHVVGKTAALILARQKRIDAAFIPFSLDEEKCRLREQLTELGVGRIIMQPGSAEWTDKAA